MRYSEHYFLSMTQRSGERGISGQTLSKEGDEAPRAGRRDMNNNAFFDLISLARSGTFHSRIKITTRLQLPLKLKKSLASCRRQNMEICHERRETGLF